MMIQVASKEWRRELRNEFALHLTLGMDSITKWKKERQNFPSFRYYFRLDHLHSLLSNFTASWEMSRLFPILEIMSIRGSLFTSLETDFITIGSFFRPSLDPNYLPSIWDCILRMDLIEMPLIFKTEVKRKSCHQIHFRSVSLLSLFWNRIRFDISPSLPFTTPHSLHLLLRLFSSLMSVIFRRNGEGGERKKYNRGRGSFCCRWAHQLVKSK